MRKYFKIVSSFALVLVLSIFMSACQTGKKSNSFYMVNFKVENADQLQKAVKEYKEITGVEIEAYSVGNSSNSIETLRADLNSKNHKPAIYSVMNVTELVEYEGGKNVIDLNSDDKRFTEEFKKLHASVPENIRLSTDGKNSYGIPYNVEGYGYIVNKALLADLFAADQEAVYKDLVNSTYAEFENFVLALNDFIQNDKTTKLTLSANDYELQAKTESSKNLTGVFATLGSEKWTYGSHLVNVALDTKFNNAAEALNTKTIDDLKGSLEAYAEVIDLQSSYTAAQNGPEKRGPEMISSAAHGYDASIQLFATGKALFIQQGNWAYTNIKDTNADIVDDLAFIPIKMPFTDENISAEGLNADKMSKSIPVFVPNYYVLNPNVSDEEFKAAQDFLVWLNTSERGQYYVKEEFAFIPYNATPDIKLSNSLGNSILSFMADENTIPNTYSGASTVWVEDKVGGNLLENYLNKEDWADTAYADIADKAIANWAELRK